MHVICLNGPINAGKSTVGRALAASLPDAVFVEGDDHGAAEDVPFPRMLEIAVGRLARAIEETEAAYLVLAYPLRDEDFARLRAATAARGARLSVVTLAPPLATLLSQRGQRVLSEGEQARIREMVQEGYAERPFSDLLLSEDVGLEVTVQRIVQWLGVDLRAGPAGRGG